MKKKIFLALVCALFTFPLLAQDKESKDGDVRIVLVKEDNSENYYYEGVVNIEGIAKEEMFKRAKEWMLSTFKTEDNNSQYNEKDMVMYNTSTALVNPGKKWYVDDYVNFKIKVMFKDGAYKYRIDNIVIKSNQLHFNKNRPAEAYNGTKMFRGGGGGAVYSNGLIKEINAMCYSLSTQLEQTIKTGNISSKKEDNW